MSDQHPFLSEAWCQSVNQILAEQRRPVTPPVQAPTLAIRTTDGRRVDLSIVDGCPQFQRAGTGSRTARTTIPTDVLTAALLEGRFDSILAAAADGRVSTIGNRETLLYFLYHLYPGGPAGAAETAVRVSELTVR